MIAEEMLSIIIDDNYKYPARGMKEVKKGGQSADFNVADLERAQKLVEDEASELSILRS